MKRLPLLLLGMAFSLSYDVAEAQSFGDDLRNWPPEDMQIRERLRERAEQKKLPSYEVMFRQKHDHSSAQKLREKAFQKANPNNEIDADEDPALQLIRVGIDDARAKSNYSKLIELLTGLSVLEITDGKEKESRIHFNEALDAYEALPLTSRNLSDGSLLLWSVATHFLRVSSKQKPELLDRDVENLARVYGRKEGFNLKRFEENPVFQYCRSENKPQLLTQVEDLIKQAGSN